MSCEIFFAPDKSNPSNRYFEFEVASTALRNGLILDLRSHLPWHRDPNGITLFGTYKPSTDSHLNKLSVGMSIPWSRNYPCPTGDSCARTSFGLLSQMRQLVILQWRPTHTLEQIFMYLRLRNTALFSRYIVSALLPSMPRKRIPPQSCLDRIWLSPYAGPDQQPRSPQACSSRLSYRTGTDLQFNWTIREDSMR